MDQWKKINFGMRYKYMLILINVSYFIISVLMISGATALKVIHREYYFVLWFSTTIKSLSSLWIATGCFLLALSVFGIVASVKQSTLMTNIYGLLLSLIFILQMASVITGFVLITKTDKIVSSSLNDMMYFSSYKDYYEDTMNWVQRTFECCGNEGPFDWRKNGKYSTFLQTEKQSGIKMPQSCCIDGSSYDFTNLMCDNFFTKGCHMHAILSESVLMIGSSAFMIGFVQILGVICDCKFARTIRRSKTNRDIQKWTIYQSMGFDQPAYSHQVETQKIHGGEGKHM